MLLSRIRIKKSILALLWLLGLGAMAGFAERRQTVRTCPGLEIRIDHTADQYFLNEEDVRRLLAPYLPAQYTQVPGQTLPLRALERALDENKFVRRAQVSRSVDGRLQVDIEQARPLARLLGAGRADRYLSDEGTLLPLSARYTARVMVVTGEARAGRPWRWEDDSSGAVAMLRLIRYIDADPFWRAQIAQVQRTAAGKLIFYPQVGRQRIEFGRPEQIEDKFDRLRVFYKDILPARGWNAYARVNVEFENQIVCE